MRETCLLAAVVERLAIVRRGLLLNRLGLRFFSTELRSTRLVGQSAVVRRFAVVRLRGCGNASERHAECQRSHANGDVLFHDFSSNRGFRTATAATVARSLQLVLSKRGNIDLKA